MPKFSRPTPIGDGVKLVGMINVNHLSSYLM